MINEIKGLKVILRKRRKDNAPFFVKWYNILRIMFQWGFAELTTSEYEEKNPDKENNETIYIEYIPIYHLRMKNIRRNVI